MGDQETTIQKYKSMSTEELESLYVLLWVILTDRDKEGA